MMRLALLASLLLVMSAGPLPTDVARGALPADYQMLTWKSIFSKTRTRPLPGGVFVRPRVEAPQPAPVATASTPVFDGAVQADDGCVGFLEDPASGKLIYVHAGDDLPDNFGKVLQVTLDSMEIRGAPEQPAKWILVGQNLAGVAASIVISSAEPAPSGAAPGSTSAPSNSSAPAAPLNDIIERMRLRRLQQGGG